jgi:predicted transcriptional regulator
MSPELSEIKVMRKKFGLTQSELAKRANVSQSLIAKVEAGRIDPTYSKAQQIFEILNNLHEKAELKANDLMEKRIISAKPDESLQQAIKKMKEHNISQLPVIEDNKSIGIVSESILLDSLINQKNASKVRELMMDAPPIVNKNTTAKAIYSLLQYSPIVLVSEHGKLCGVITKADIITRLAKP